MLNIPDKAKFNKRIPKIKFYEKIGANTKLERKFIDEINSIVWKYKLSEETLNLESTKEVEEIQIFEINLKTRNISKEILENIDRVIPYPILYIIRHKDNSKFCIAYKERNKLDDNKMVINSYYESDWERDKDIKFDILKGLTLKDIYENIIRQLIPIKSKNKEDIKSLIKLNKEQEKLLKHIEKLKKKRNSEKQFNKQVAINIELQKKEKELERIMED